MKLKKQALAFVMTSLVLLSALAGCADKGAASSSQPAPPSSQENSETLQKETVRVAALKGPTGLGMVKLMADADAGTASNGYQFQIANSPDEVVGKITNGEIDVAAVPTNLAATLYNKTKGKVQIAAVNTLGVLYVLENGENVKSVSDLKGKTLYATGQGSTPEYAVNYILAQNGMKAGKDVTVEYKAEHAELATLLISGKASLGVLPEPFVTQVLQKNPKVKIALDITKEWDRAVEKSGSGKSALDMGCILVRTDFTRKNGKAFDAFLSEYQNSQEYVNQNASAASSLSEKYDIMPAKVAEKAIPNCNIVYIDGEKMKTQVSDFLKILYQSDPKSVGGALPGDDFYYVRSD